MKPSSHLLLFQVKGALENARATGADPARARMAGERMALGKATVRMAKAGMARAAAVRRANMVVDWRVER